MDNAFAFDWENLVKWFTILIVAATLWALWFWTLIDCLKNEPSSAKERISWTMIVFFGQFFGALIYITVRRPKRKSIYGQ